jgi:hypothetical protein
MNLFPMRVDTDVIAVSVTTSASTPVALSEEARAIRIVNTGTATAFVCVRNVSTNAAVPTGTASTTGCPVLAGSDVVFTMEYGTSPNFFSAITATGTTTLYVQIGEGV